MTPVRALAIILLSLTVLGCRKGEKDPLISLNSRKARLSGDWRMESGKATLNYRYRTTNGNPGIYNESFTFDEKGLKLFTNESGSPVYYVGSYLLSLAINKDGTFDMEEKIQGATFSGSGSWAFSAGIGEKKNRESVVFTLDAASAGSSRFHIFNRLSTTFSYDIIELRSKRITLESAGKLYMNDFGEYVTCGSEFHFTQ